jgi:hypothetical protein
VRWFQLYITPNNGIVFTQAPVGTDLAPRFMAAQVQKTNRTCAFSRGQCFGQVVTRIASSIAFVIY